MKNPQKGLLNVFLEFTSVKDRLQCTCNSLKPRKIILKCFVGCCFPLVQSNWKIDLSANLYEESTDLFDFLDVCYLV